MITSTYRGWLRAGLAALLIFPIIVLDGCSKKGADKAASISGKVSYNGAPVTGGKLILHPAEGKGSALPVDLKSDGTFQSGGVPLGAMKVTIETESIKSMGNSMYPESGPVPPGGRPKPPENISANMPKYVKIPPKYASPNTTDLTWTIDKGKNNKEFNLKDD